MKFVAIAILFLSAYSFTSGRPDIHRRLDDRIYNGATAADKEFPWIVSITNAAGQHLCGGFIYNTRWIVTAASCVEGKIATELRAIAGEQTLTTTDPGEQRLQILDVVLYNLYDSQSKLHNLALIETVQTIVFTEYATFIIYDEADTTITATLAGWGAIDSGLGPSIRLRKTTVNIADINCTIPQYEEYNKNYMICGDDVSGGGHPCEFDEGGPLTQVTATGQPIVIGIMSKNQGCDNLNIPTTYTRLVSYYSWFRSTAGVQPTPTVTTTLSPVSDEY